MQALLKAAEVADLLAMSLPVVYRLIRSGELAVVRTTDRAVRVRHATRSRELELVFLDWDVMGQNEEAL